MSVDDDVEELKKTALSQEQVRAAVSKGLEAITNRAVTQLTVAAQTLGRICETDRERIDNLVEQVQDARQSAATWRMAAICFGTANFLQLAARLFGWLGVALIWQ